MGQKIVDNLRTLGLSENEAEVYMALVQCGPCFVAPLVQETRKHRQMVYNALETLLQRNLIARSVQRGKFFYEIANPERLMEAVREQEAVAQATVEQVRDRMRSLEEQVEALRGREAFGRAIGELAASAERTGEYLVINSIPSEYGAIISPFQEEFLRRLEAVREKGGALRVLLFGENEYAARTAVLGQQFFGRPFESRAVRDVPEPPQAIWVSGTDVYLRNRLNDPLMIHITSPDLSQRYRSYFYALWEGAAPLEGGE